MEHLTVAWIEVMLDNLELVLLLELCPVCLQGHHLTQSKERQKPMKSMSDLHNVLQMEYQKVMQK